MKRNIIAIGTSSGGVKALKDLVAGFTPEMDASVFIVWHMPQYAEGLLPRLLEGYCDWPAVNATDGESIRARTIYVAPPDHHMILEPGVVRITKGPKENRFRPAVDPLFRSAARSYGPQVIGVILSGGLDDGTAGLWTIKSRGGITVVQDPVEADEPSMPLNALKNVEVDHRLGAGEIGILLSRLSLTDANEAPEISDGELQKTEIEIQIASEDGALTRGIRLIGEPSSFSCPDCQGVMLELKDGKIVRFRCHTGHAYTADSFLETVSANVEKELWSSERAIEELVMLLNHLGDELERLGESESAGRYRAKAQNTQREADAVLELIKNHELVTAEMLRNEVSA